MKQIKKINSAEGIFLLSFNQLINKLEEYTAKNCKVSQGWDSMGITSKENSFSLTWKGEVNSEDYDRLLLSMNFHPQISLNIFAVINGKRCLVVENQKGGNSPIEPKGEIPQNAHITEISFEFSGDKGALDKHSVTLYWAGFSNSSREHLIEEELPRYDKSSWDGYINYDVKPTADKNIMFTEEKIEEFKRNINSPQYKEFFDKFYDKVEEVFPNYEPESEIREYIPVGNHLYRYARLRDRGRHSVGIVSDLAAGGYFFDKPEWTAMAARLVMCIVRTPHWFEGPQGNVEGSTWHHVCFMEEAHVTSIAKALGFMGGVFTPKALDEIMAAMKKHYSTVLKCCKEEGYRRYSNQGIVGNTARMTGACCFGLFGDHSYEAEVEACYKDHTDMMNDYINDEHHCVEGIGYYQYSIGTSIGLWMTYARYKNTAVKNVIPKAMENSIDYLNCIVSSMFDDGRLLPINAGGGVWYPSISEMILNLVVALYDWNLGKKYMANRNIGAESMNVELIPGLMLMILSEENKDNTYVEEEMPKYCIFEKSGLASYEFENGKFWYYAERNPRTGHYHNDRGDVVLELDGKVILAEIGMCSYSSTLSGYMHTEQYHNVAHPDGIPMRVASEISAVAAAEAGVGCTTVVTLADFEHPQAQTKYIRKIENGLEFASDLSEIFDERVVEASREGRFVSGKVPELSLCDTWEISEPTSMYVNFMSYGEWVIDGNTASSENDGVKITLSFEVDNEFELLTDDSMKDGALNQVYRLRVKTAPSCKHRIITTGKVE